MDPKVKSINIRKNTDRVFIFIHGYTGSTTDFGELPKYLSNKFNASVICKLLPGHGTKIEDLQDKKLESFIEVIEKDIKRELKKNNKIILVGLSFGAQLAKYFASKYNVNGIIICSTTHHLLFPGNIPGIGLLGYWKKSFNKNYSPMEMELRKNAFSYSKMPLKSILLSRKLKHLTKKNFKKINCPALFIHAKKERLGNYRSLEKILRKIRSKVKEIFLLDIDNHNLFYSSERERVKQKIKNFIHDNKLFYNKTTREKATAIVPAFNEVKRIGGVLSQLLKSKYINEIIVIDDGSKDGTENVVKKYYSIKYHKNNRNMGKGYSMDLGVKLAKNNTIFFCDADLINFKAKFADEMILPVLSNETPMFIGMRSNLMQRTVTSWGLNSGERALKKETWFALPKFYKYRYRIEAGLNHYVKNYCNGLDWRMFNYSQPIKEKKYGLIKGTILRWWMNVDVILSYFSFPFIYNYVKNKKSFP